MTGNEDRKNAAGRKPGITADEEGPEEILDDIVEADEYQAVYALIRGEEFSMKSEKP
ncbi:MAG TPA: hypothetical protein PKA10_05190 [Selenomonadales bacterium]|nr:hypothetical protein [Selenomonadales bacterium]